MMSKPVSSENLRPEILDLGLDIKKLEAHLRQHVMSTPPTMQTPRFGGWSVWSSNGDVADGWGQGHLSLSKAGDRVVYDPAKFASQGLVSTEHYNAPTEICFGYLAEIMNRIDEMGLHPRRARIAMLPPSGETDMHQDASSEFYSVRLHVPIITNPECFFEYENGPRFHMKADGSGVLVRVNRMHRAGNFGPVPRFHLIMNVLDSTGVTAEHRWRPELENPSGWDSKNIAIKKKS